MAVSDSVKEKRNKLPVFRAKNEIIEAVKNNKTVIFIGETSNGKSTQIPQYLLESELGKNICIAITQPYKFATISLAELVAQEVGTEIGCKVGYTVKFEKCASAASKIKFLTDDMLLREAALNPLLSDYSIIILDEVHERTLNTDILFGIVKVAQSLREQHHKSNLLKVIMISASFDYKRLSEYFDNAPVYFISGREYKVKIKNSIQKQHDYVHSALVTIFQIHRNEGEGDILVYVTGEEEVDSMVSEVQKISKELPLGCPRIMALRLYSVPPANQRIDILKPTPPGFRKVIIATSIAETSIKITGVKFVIDTGMIKTKSYNSLCGSEILSVQRISKAQANQRAGRASRDTNGSCFRLYTSEEFKDFKDHTVPEILRCCLSSAILHIVHMGIKNVKKFDYIDKPPVENIEAAVRQLKLLNAVTEKDGNLELTETGKKMIKFPLEPKFSKMILSSKEYKCTDEILSIISLLSVETIFIDHLSQLKQFAEARKKFETADGDHIMLLNIYKAYRRLKPDAKLAWCQENFINTKNMKTVVNVRNCLSQICEKIDIPPSSSSHDTNKIRRCLISGLFMNTATSFRNKNSMIMFRTLEGNQKVRIHASSCLLETQPNYLVYTELVKASELYMKYVSLVTEDDILEVIPDYFEEKLSIEDQCSISET